MEANLTLNRFRIRDTSVNVNIPPNDLAKLMYYLSCVNSVIRVADLSPYINYNVYYLMLGQINTIINLAKIYSPDKMISCKAFIQDDSLGDQNKFFQITDETYGVHANEEFFIGGKTVRISQIMVYRNDWILKNYYLPLRRLTMPPPIFLPALSSPYIYNNNNFPGTYNDDELCCCAIF